MAFEDKMKKMESIIVQDTRKKEDEPVVPRISKSYTLQKKVADALAEKAKEEDLTASRFLEKLLKKEFGL